MSLYDGHIEYNNTIMVQLVKSSADDMHVTDAARVSTLGSTVSPPSDEGLIGYLMRNRHGSPFEHTSMTFLVTAPIFVWREHMRHRAGFSYNEESGRYRRLDPVFYLPSRERNLVQVGKPGSYTFKPGTDEQHEDMAFSFEEVALLAYSHYLEMIENGIAREVARMVLPLNIYSSAYVTMNARSMMNFLSLRTQDDTAMFPSYPQREIEMLAEQYERHFAELMPLTHAAFAANGRVAP
jgi:thymidylate synthase (FAD)